MPVLVDENLGRVACPVCGTEYDDKAPSCPKCGAMSLESKKALIKGEGRPVPLTVSQPAAQPRPAGLTPLGLGTAQRGYPPQGHLFMRPRQQEDPVSIWLGIVGIFLGFGGMMIGMMWIILPGDICKVLAFVLDFAALGIGAVLLKKGSKMGMAVMVFGVMALFMTLLLMGIFWMVGL